MARARKIVGTVATVVVAVIVVAGGDAVAFRHVPERDSPSPANFRGSRRRQGANTVAVARVSRPHEADIIGSVQAELRTTIASRLTANIVEMRVRAGDHVKKNDVLMLLDDRDLKSRVAQARETLRAAEAMRDMARIEVDRLTPMVQQKVASEYELDQWRTKQSAAVAEVVRAGTGHPGGGGGAVGHSDSRSI